MIIRFKTLPLRTMCFPLAWVALLGSATTGALVSPPASAAPEKAAKTMPPETGFSRVLAPQTVTEFRLRVGAKKTTATVAGADSKALTLALAAGDGSLRDKGEIIPLADAVIGISLKAPDGELLFRNDYYVRPNPATYKGEERAALLARWSTLPPASAHELRIKIISGADGVGLWVDDRFVGQASLALPATLQVTGAEAESIASRPIAVERARFVPLNLQGYSPRQNDSAILPLTRGSLQVRNGVPFQVLGTNEVLDVARSRWLDEKTGPGAYVDQQYVRSSFDRNPDNILLAVPTDDYSRAHVLAVVDPDPAKTPVLTLSLSRYTSDGGDSGGRGDGIAYSSIRLERKNGKWPPGVRQIGTVRRKNSAGKEQSLPLLQVAIPLRAGEIPDVIDETGLVRGRSTQHLDLELTKELHPVRTKNYSSFSFKPLGKPSGVLVYGFTLERAPVKARVLPRQTGNIFYRTEKIGFDVQLHNRSAHNFAGKLRWELTDFYGQTTRGEKSVRLPAQNAAASLPIELPNLALGWYRTTISLADDKGAVLWRQPSSLAVLAPDTRRAGLDSPYGAWWFRASHGGTDSLAEIAPLFRRMGFRHTNPGGTPVDGAEFARHGLSPSTLPFLRKGALEDVLPKLDEWIAKNPQVPRAMIFHESGSGAGWTFPPEFLGQPKPQMNEKQRAAYDAEVTRGIAYARYLREKYPHLKLTVGNGPLPFISGLMQNDYPKELVDAWGDEEVGQANIPEAPPTSSQSDFFWIQEYSKKYGYNKPVTTAYEWRGRGTNPGNLSELEQAQYYTRDVLKALAFGADSINPGLIHDVGDSYYYSRWGAGGFLHRYPLLNPKISYVAMAVLTQELDGARLLRVLPTDSPTLHAMEFQQNGDYVYALWVPRGEKSVRVTFSADGAAQLTDINGRRAMMPLQNRQAQITVGESPLYLRVPFTIAKLESGATRTAAPGSTPRPVAARDDVANWKADRTPDATLETAHFDFPRRVGAITARRVAESPKQSALELTLAPEPDVPWPIARYVTLRPARAVPLAGEPQAVGVWVNGNSCWGRVFFELEDAQGEKFTSIGAEDGGWSLGDWKGETAINFDGWNYVSVKLPANYASGFYQPQQNNWRSSGGDGVLQYPVKVSKIVVTMRDKIVQIDRVVDVPERSIRLMGLGGS